MHDNLISKLKNINFTLFIILHKKTIYLIDQIYVYKNKILFLCNKAEPNISIKWYFNNQNKIVFSIDLRTQIKYKIQV